MTSDKSLTLPGSSSQSVEFHLWPAGEPRKPADWRALKSMLIRRRKALLSVFGGVLGLLVLILLLLPSVYRATATLQVAIESPYVSENDLPVLTDITGSNQGRSLVTQSEILQNQSVRERALQLLTPQQRGAVGGMTVKSVPETDLITVTATSRDAKVAAEYANAICNAYLELSRDKSRSRYTTARRYVGTQLIAARDRLDKARASLRDFKEANGTVDLAAETQNKLAELNRVQSEWRQARADKDAAVAQMNRLQSLVSGIKPTVAASKIVVRSPELVAMQAKLTDLELRRVEALREFQPTAPEVQELQREISLLKGQLQNQAQTEVQSVQQSPNPIFVDAQQNIVRLKGEIWSQEARGVALKKLSERLGSELKVLPAREQRLAELNTDIDGLQQSYNTLNSKYQNLRASEASRVGAGNLLFAAQPPDKPNRRLNPMSLFMSLVFAALVALAYAAVLERADNRIHAPRDLPAGTGFNVLAQVPAIGRDGEQYLFNTRALLSPLLENFRGLWTMIGLRAKAASQPIPRTLAVTSSLSGEGKSLVAVNLAAAGALSGARVVVVDCNLRWPTLHQICGRPNDVGFINVVQGETTLENALQTTRVPGLHVLTSGPRSDNPFQALNSPAGREVLRRLSEIADLVVIDTPPVLMLADARLTASLVDGVLLVVSTDQPTKDDIANASDLLRQGGANIAGVVLNKVEAGPDFKDYYDQFPVHGNTFTTDAAPGSINRNATLMPQSRSPREK